MAGAARGCSSMVELQVSNLLTRVRFPSPALARAFTGPVPPEGRPGGTGGGGSFLGETGGCVLASRWGGLRNYWRAGSVATTGGGKSHLAVPRPVVGLASGAVASQVNRRGYGKAASDERPVAVDRPPGEPNGCRRSGSGRAARGPRASTRTEWCRMARVTHIHDHPQESRLTGGDPALRGRQGPPGPGRPGPRPGWSGHLRARPEVVRARQAHAVPTAARPHTSATSSPVRRR